jgi:hypothetical protein
VRSALTDLGRLTSDPEEHEYGAVELQHLLVSNASKLRSNFHFRNRRYLVNHEPGRGFQPVLFAGFDPKAK